MGLTSHVSSSFIAVLGLSVPTEVGVSVFKGCGIHVHTYLYSHNMVECNDSMYIFVLMHILGKENSR